jgi:hypothetical protein
MAAAARINYELTRTNPQMSLSSAPRTRLEVVHAEFLGDVGQAPVQMARRANVATVDESHADEAYTQIGSAAGDSPVPTIANTLGRTISGAGLASIYFIVFTSGVHGTSEIVTAVVLNVVGFVLLTLGLTLTAARRRR